MTFAARDPDPGQAGCDVGCAVAARIDRLCRVPTGPAEAGAIGRMAAGTWSGMGHGNGM